MERTEDRELFRLYDWTGKAFDALRQKGHTVVVIHGPRAYGKGECVQKLTELHPRLVSGTIINGRTPSEAVPKIRSVLGMVHDGPLEEWVVVENLDRLVGQVPAEPPSRRLNAEETDAISDLLNATLGGARARLRLIVTTTRAPHEIVGREHTISYVLAGAGKISLHEHEEEWRAGLRGSLDDMAQALPERPSSLAAWIWEQTDGHPALLRTALSLVSSALALKNAAGETHLRAMVRAGLLVEGTAPVRRQLTRWLTYEGGVPVTGEPEDVSRVTELLRNVLSTDPDQLLELLPRMHDLLFESGLLRHVGGTFPAYRVVAGVLREILYDELGVTPRPRVMARIDRAHERIVVRVNSGLAAGSAELTGNSYQLGLLFFGPGSEVVSPLDHPLRNTRTGEDLSEKGKATAVNRFLNEVNGIVHGFPLVANVRGQGYRLLRDDREVEIEGEDAA